MEFTDTTKNRTLMVLIDKGAHSNVSPFSMHGGFPYCVVFRAALQKDLKASDRSQEHHESLI